MHCGVLVLDTNVLIDYLNGDAIAVGFVDHAREEPHERFAISMTTVVEILASPVLKPGEELYIDRLLAQLDTTGLYESIARSAARLRRIHRLKLGDAVIAATAEYHRATLVTRDRDLAKRAKMARIAVELI